MYWEFCHQNKIKHKKNYFIPKSKESKGKVYCYGEDGGKWDNQK